MKKLGVVLSLILATVLVGHSQSAKPSKRYHSISKDGAWCWFSDPRAVSLNQKVYAGWVTTDGSIMVGSYDEKTGDSQEVTLYPQFNQDDHANPGEAREQAILCEEKNIFQFNHLLNNNNSREVGISYSPAYRGELTLRCLPTCRLRSTGSPLST